MFRFLFLAFLLTPLIEIGVFIQVGGLIGLMPTLITVFVTAIIGVWLLRQQGFASWGKIQQQLAEGKVPAIEMAAAVQLFLAGALLLTPGFVTDAVGFTLLVPAVRKAIAIRMLSHWQQGTSSSAFFYSQQTGNHHSGFQQNTSGRVFEGEFDDESKPENTEHNHRLNR